MPRVAATLIGIAVLLVSLGLVMLASTSGVRSETFYSTRYFFVQRQVVWLALSACVCLVFARMDYRRLRLWAKPALIGTLLLLVATLVPGIGREVNGSWRWISLGPVNIQSSELAKFAILLYLAAALHELSTGKPWGLSDTLLRAFLPLGLVLALIFISPDFGTTMLIALVAAGVMFIAGVRVRYLAVAGTLGAVGFIVLLMNNAVRMRRIMAFWKPTEYAEHEAFQLLNALYAFVAGGVRGAGLGGSLQKHFFLPECHTDFILPIIAEELGLTASLGVLLLFFGLFACGVTIAWRARDPFGRLLASGITLTLSLQTAINIAVVTGCVPTKGLALPFISYGGSSLIVSGMLLGVLVSIARIAGADASLSAHAKDRIRAI